MSTINPTTNTSLPIEDQDLDHGVWDVLYDMPAWGISLLVHIGIIVALGSIWPTANPPTGLFQVLSDFAPLLFVATVIGTLGTVLSVYKLLHNTFLGQLRLEHESGRAWTYQLEAPHCRPGEVTDG